MCNNTTTNVHHRSPSSLMNGIVEPFPFSTFHFLRQCNRLLIPTTDLRPYYNFPKDPDKTMDYLNNENKIINSNTNSHSHHNRHHHHNHHQKSDLYSSISDLFSIPVTATPPTITESTLNKHTNISSEQIPSILSASTSAPLSRLSSFNYPLQLQPPSPAATSSDNTNMEYPLGPHNRIADLNYTNLMNRRQRGEKRPIPDEQKDEKYYERRKRNNEAAKKSRDARKLREDRIAFRAAILEQENAILRAQLIALREEMSTMRQIIGTRPAQISVNL